MTRARILGLALLAAVAAGGAGCSEWNYYDVDVSFSGFTGISTTSTIQNCHVYVTGAETHDFNITDQCPPANNGFHMGTFEYASLASSGKLTFEMKVYDGFETCPPFGDGSTTVNVGGMTTTMTTMTVTPTGMGCALN